MDEIVKDILLLIIGAAIALLSHWATAWIERETTASNEIFNRRLNALNEIWLTFMALKDVYASKVPMGYENWINAYKEEAEEKLNSFRRLVDASQVILPKTIVEKLREIDSYMHASLCNKDQKPSEYVAEINKLLAKLSTEANSHLKKRTHAIDLYFRT